MKQKIGNRFHPPLEKKNPQKLFKPSNPKGQLSSRKSKFWGRWLLLYCIIIHFKIHFISLFVYKEAYIVGPYIVHAILTVP